MPCDNPASRLLALLTTAKGIDGNTPSSRAWGELLDAQGNQALLLSRMGKLLQLPGEVTARLSSAAGVQPQVISHISSQFYAAFSAHKFGEKWAEFTNRIDIHMLNYLGLASNLLEAQTETKRLETEDLEKLRADFTDLLERVRGSNITPRLKAYVVLQLHALITALDDYFITGAEPILKQIEATVGHAYVDPAYKGFLKDHELGKSLLGCLAAAANMVTVVVGIAQLEQLVRQLLTHVG